MGNRAPVIVFTYNRPKHTKATLLALNNCDLSNETELFIFCDNYKKEKDVTLVNQVRLFVDEFKMKNNFVRTTVIKAEKNKGLAASIIDGVTNIINRFKCVIVVEDDLVVSRHFLRYMNDALDFYKDECRIWAISGYSFPMKSLSTYNHDVFMTGRGCSWGWATWDDRWNTVDWNLNDYARFKHNWVLRAKFGKWGKDMPTMLDYQMNLNINSWAIRWCYAAFVQNKLTVYPKKSFLINCGIDGSGVHSANTTINRFETNADNNDEYKCCFENLMPVRTIQKEFAHKYSNGMYDDVKEQIKAFLVRNHMYKKK